MSPLHRRPSRLTRSIAFAAFAAGSFAAIPSAHAQDEKDPQPSSTMGPPAPPPSETTRAPRETGDDSRKHVTVTVNPLGIAIERYGANIEVVPVPHHAIVGSLYAQSVPTWMARSVSGRSEINESAGSSLGGEIGYRLYSGTVGADGLFAGASFVSMPLAYPRLADDLRSADLRRFTASGAALDIGVQKVTSSGFTIGGGIGVMYLAYSLPEDTRRIPLAIEPHVLPRLLLAAGWSF